MKPCTFLLFLFLSHLLPSCTDSEKKDLGKDKIHSMINKLKMGYDTTSFSVLHYDSLVTEFEAQQPSEGCVLFLGNSITEGGDWSQLLKNQKTINHGIGGDLTFGVLRRLSVVIKHKPSHIFLMIGINDIFRKVPDSLVVNNINAIVDTLHRELPKTKIFVQSLLPINLDLDAFPSAEEDNKRVLTINRALKKNKNQRPYTYLELHSHFTNEWGKLKEALTYDGIHLNSKGYDMWVEVLKSEGVLDQ